MNIVTIAYKSLRSRALASSLTALSVALGVMMMVAVLVIHGIVGETFNQRSVGVGLVVGPRSSELGMVLNAIYRVGRAGEPLPYAFYKDVLLGKDQEWADWIEHAIPLTMGDVTEEGAFPIVGTTAEYFTVEYVPGRRFLIRGELPLKPFEAVIGLRVAQQNGWSLGSEFRLVHGGAESDHIHNETFKVVGILAATGTANDKTAFVNLEGFYMVAGHEKPVGEAVRRLRDFGFEVTPEREARLQRMAANIQKEHDATNRLFEDAKKAGLPPPKIVPHTHAAPDEFKEVSYIFVRTKNPSQSIFLTSKINEGKIAQAVNPIPVIYQLMNDLVGNVRLLLLVLTGLIVVVAGVGIFVSIYNSMSDRRREIAIMRSLGAHRTTVLGIILGEAMLLCIGGGILGLLFGHGLVVIAAPIVEAKAGLILNPWKFEPVELLLFPVLLLLAAGVGILPGLTAYRTDVAQSLSE